tara:strand:- start:218 stop:577 length:360 start_codon:yes stop_codon:yes gene_type:complete
MFECSYREDNFFSSYSILSAVNESSYNLSRSGLIARIFSSGVIGVNSRTFGLSYSNCLLIRDSDLDTQLKLFSDFSEILLKNLISVGVTRLFCYFCEKAPNVLDIYLVLATLGDAVGDI